MEQEIGKVIHYYDKLGVAIVELLAPLTVGDTIRIKWGEEEFKQTIDSMQAEHQSVQSAQAGSQVGIKVSQKAKEGAVVFRVTG